MQNEYYVYVYIDPRNFEEFYYGKGKDSRKDAHLLDRSDSEKTRRIAEIKKIGLEPIIRVIAKGLSEHDALLVEKTLLWKLGRHLTNVSSGHYSDNFRPHNTLHTQLSGFDYQNAIYYYNVGEGLHRNWDDYVNFGFISAGHGDSPRDVKRYRDAMLGFNKGDLIAAYLTKRGFVGIGQLTSIAKPIREVSIQGKSLLSHDLQCKDMIKDDNSGESCEYVATINWIKTTSREEAKNKRKSGIYTTTHIRASLDGQPETIKFLEQEFEIKFTDYII